MKRRALLALGATSATLLLAFACSFPEVTITSTPGGDSGADSTSDGPGDAGSSMDGNLVDVVFSDGFYDAPTSDVLLSSGDAGDGGDPCDLDNDGYRSTTCEAGAPGGDCDDKDSKANPGVTQYQDTPAELGRVNGNWNCNGSVEEDPALPVVQCTLVNGLCSGHGWYQSKPACGHGNLVVDCALVSLQCKPTNGQTIILKCK